MKIAIYCSARDVFSEDQLGRYSDLCKKIANKGGSLVYGGGRAGLMGHVADAFLGAGAEVMGVIPTGLFDVEIAHTGCTHLIETKDLMERKLKMMTEADAVLILPGGLGTLDELFEVATWKVLGAWQKPIVIWNDGGFWDSLKVLLEDLKSKGVLDDNTLSGMSWAETTEQAMTQLGF